MSEQTKIAWCDSTVNFWEGCTKVSAGCANCYAEARDKRFTGGKLWGKGAPRRKSKSAVKDALAFNRKPWICDECGHSANGQYDECECGGVGAGAVKRHRRRNFSLSLGDWLDAELPIEMLAEALHTIWKCRDCIWILCSKRWENWRDRMEQVAEWHEDDGAKTYVYGEQFDNWLNAWIEDEPPANIIGLCSVENQEMADARIPQFLTVPLACRGLSLEPLLGPVNLFNATCLNDMKSGGAELRDFLSWLIIGGESGPNARPCNVDWIRSLVAQGQAAGVATFVKQLGVIVEVDHEPHADGRVEAGEFHHMKLRDKKGGDPAEWPADLRVQEWPKGF